MDFFPQLATGSVTQFPSEKTVRRRTVVTEAADGSTLKLADAGAGEVEWELTLRGMTAAEWTAVERLFERAAGRAGTFTFLDPFDNLLTWSEELNATAWTRPNGLALTPGMADPLGGQKATRTSGGGWIEQSVAAPGGYQYCVSVYARSAANCEVTLYAKAGTKRVERVFMAGPAWRRLAFACRPEQATESVSFGIELPPTAVDVFGVQAEPQAGASAYKATGARSGVRPNTSFASDALEMTSEGLNAYSCSVRLRAGMD
jgi:hypothetical protein